VSFKCFILFKKVPVQADPLPNWQFVLEELVVSILRRGLSPVIGGIREEDRRVGRGRYWRLDAEASEQLMEKRLKTCWRELTAVNTKYVVV
jgi:hypothetical protein